MNDEIKNNISKCIGYYKTHIELIEEYYPKSQYGDIQKRLVYASILDAISRISCPSNRSNHDRVVNFIKDHCSWTDCNRVSLTHLLRLVGEKPESEYQPLKEFASQRISQWTPASKILISRDPLISEIELLWPKNADGSLQRIRMNKINGNQKDDDLKIPGIGLYELQHCHLLYTYRNSLIHEFRPVGRHVELWDDAEPYYAYLTEYQNENSRRLVHTWELQYTTRFFKSLCVSGLNNLNTYLETNSVDPFQSFDWGNYWITELNQY